MAGNVVLVKILKAGALKEMEIAVQERIESIKHKVKVFEKKNQEAIRFAKRQDTLEEWARNTIE